jgi:predicted aconitase
LLPILLDKGLHTLAVRRSDAMHLSREEQAIARGDRGLPAKLLFEQQMAVGAFFGAERFVPVSHVHLCADYEVMGDAGAEMIAGLAHGGVSLCVPTTGSAGCLAGDLDERFAPSSHVFDCEQGVLQNLRQLGVLTVGACNPAQGVYVPRLGEHLAWGDSGAVTFTNAVLGARSNFESGPAALAAAVTGRTPAYGFHLERHRAPTLGVHVMAEVHDVADWGALGALVGLRAGGYSCVPFFEFDDAQPLADDLKQLASALACYGSIAMFHVAGITPEAHLYHDLLPSLPQDEVSESDVVSYLESFGPQEGAVNLVVFGAPHLSLAEMDTIVRLLAGRRVAETCTVVVSTSAMQQAAAKNAGTLDALLAAGVHVLTGTNWYNTQISALRERLGWSRLVTNSAKLANAVGVQGYEAVLAATHVCVEAAVHGRFP